MVHEAPSRTLYPTSVTILQRKPACKPFYDVGECRMSSQCCICGIYLREWLDNTTSSWTGRFGLFFGTYHSGILLSNPGKASNQSISESMRSVINDYIDLASIRRFLMKAENSIILFLLTWQSSEEHFTIHILPSLPHCMIVFVVAVVVKKSCTNLQDLSLNSNSPIFVSHLKCGPSLSSHKTMDIALAHI